MNRCSIVLALVCLLTWSCDRSDKAAGPTWERVAAGTRGLENPGMMEGRVVFYEEHTGLRDEFRLIKVEVAPARLGRLLGQLGLDPELKECAAGDFRPASADSRWRLPETLTVVPCTVGKVEHHGEDEWVAQAYVTGDAGGGKQVVFLRLYDSLD